ncbi:trans-Golgi network integral membrane protein 1-like isoform X2 [Zophobas morio]|uniref:trans-Golgi network integral membrane protein 1-like isoform X2 n=1 Tax=Zophobas morio TaxID=2755281 RepID=UPI003083C9C7
MNYNYPTNALIQLTKQIPQLVFRKTSTAHQVQPFSRQYIIMNCLTILCLISVGSYVGCAPTKPDNPKTFYDAVIEKCPLLQARMSLKNHPIFTACTNWTAISEVNKLSGENVKDVRCLLYFESFTELCTKTPNVNISLLNSVLIEYPLEAVCEYAKNTSNKNLNAIFSSAHSCKKICLDDFGMVYSICRISYNFAHYQPVQDQEPPKVVESQDAKNEHPSEQNTETNTGEVLNNKNSKVDKVAANAAKNHGPVSAEGAVHPVIKPNSNGVPALPGTDNEGDTGNQEVAPEVGAPAQQPVVDHEEQNRDAKDKAKDGVEPAQQDIAASATLDVPTQVQSAEVHEVNEDANQKPETVNQKPDNTKTVQSSPKEVESTNEDTAMDILEDKGSQNLPVNGDPDVGDDDVDLTDGAEEENLAANSVHAEKDSKPMKTDESEPANYNTEMDGDSNFFTYFMLLCIIFIVAYVCYHNKQKILALILEGRRGKRQYRGRRPNSANYHKLDSNLEEAITSSCKKNTNNVIY